MRPGLTIGSGEREFSDSSLKFEDGGKGSFKPLTERSLPPVAIVEPAIP